MSLRVTWVLAACVLPALGACAQMPAEYGVTLASQSKLPPAPPPPALPPETGAPEVPAAPRAPSTPTPLLAQAPTPAASPSAPSAAAADFARLLDRSWRWHSTQFSDDKRVTSGAPERYTLQLGADGRATVRADCNRGSGTYSRGPEARALAFSALMTTKIGCPPGSQDAEFLREVAMVSGWRMADDDLILLFKLDTGSMRFRAQP